MNKEHKTTLTEKPSDMLLASVVTRGKGSQLMNLLRREGAAYAVCAFAEGTIPSHILHMLGIAKTKKELVFAFINQEIEEACYQSLAKEMKLDQTGHGVAFSIPLCSYPEPLTETELAAAFIIVDKGKGEDVLDLLDELELRGGTLLSAFGGASMTDILFNLPIQPEKEVIFMVAPKEPLPKMLRTLDEKMSMSQPHQGIAITFAITRAIGLYSEGKKGK
ncbi:MAG TPA: hypothetical protein PLU23_04685 [Anaerolineaceae bacterium]|nr:hypothetical protein [Chloroflexota bacterium]HPL81780.1 hypothetical protein [Anaerolineaceae bacterium]